MDLIEPGKENQSPPTNNRTISPVLKFQLEDQTSPRSSFHAPKLSKAIQEAAAAKRAKQRWQRMSRGENMLGGFDPYHRKSTLRGSFMRMNRSGSLLETSPSQIRFENTFRMKPKGKPKLTQCKEMTNDVLKVTLDGEKYHHVDSKQLQLGITNEIKSRLKEMKLIPDCYKVIVHSIVGQRYVEGEKNGIKSQVEIKNSSRTLDMTEFDTHYSMNYVNSTMFCVVTVYMITID